MKHFINEKIFSSFHTVTEDGNPWLDMSHIVSTLNKLDAGTLEKVRKNHLTTLTHFHVFFL